MANPWSVALGVIVFIAFVIGILYAIPTTRCDVFKQDCGDGQTTCPNPPFKDDDNNILPQVCYNGTTCSKPTDDTCTDSSGVLYDQEKVSPYSLTRATPPPAPTCPSAPFKDADNILPQVCYNGTTCTEPDDNNQCSSTDSSDVLYDQAQQDPYSLTPVSNTSGYRPRRVNINSYNLK